MPAEIDPFVPQNAMVNLDGAISSLFGLFDPRAGKNTAPINPITVAFYCGVVSCRRDDVVIGADRHRYITQAIAACMAFAVNPDTGMADMRRRRQIAVLLARATGDNKYE